MRGRVQFALGRAEVASASGLADTDLLAGSLQGFLDRMPCATPTACRARSRSDRASRRSVGSSWPARSTAPCRCSTTTGATSVGPASTRPAGAVGRRPPAAPPPLVACRASRWPTRPLGAIADGIVTQDTAVAGASRPTQTALAAAGHRHDSVDRRPERQGWTRAPGAAVGQPGGRAPRAPPAGGRRRVWRGAAADHRHRRAARLARRAGGRPARRRRGGLFAGARRGRAVAELAVPLPATGETLAAGDDPLRDPYVDDSGAVLLQPKQPVPLTLLVTPGADVTVTTGLLPQKSIGMRR